MDMIESIARIAHEANRGYCTALGDQSQLRWEEAPEWQRESAIKGVRFLISDPAASPAASHESWLAEKIATGWKYGPVKDADKKEHPCCVPYDALPVEQKAKDYIFQSVVRSMLYSALQPINISPLAADAIRHKFNPSNRSDVAQIKNLTGTLITVMEGVGNVEAFAAIQHIQTASMWSVLAATKGL